MSTSLSTKLWLAWFLVSFFSFLIPEIVALASGHPEHTLSAAIWRMEDYNPSKGQRTWNAFHFLFMCQLLTVDVWLFFHFILRKFT